MPITSVLPSAATAILIRVNGFPEKEYPAAAWKEAGADFLRKVRGKPGNAVNGSRICFGKNHLTLHNGSPDTDYYSLSASFGTDNRETYPQTHSRSAMIRAEKNRASVEQALEKFAADTRVRILAIPTPHPRTLFVWKNADGTICSSTVISSAL